MKRNPLISICILNRNWEGRLQKIVPSVLQQVYDNLEILLIDNDSVDKSLEYIQQFPQIRIIQNSTNLWVSWGRNVAVEKCSWEYVFLVDNDIELTKIDFIWELLQHYKELKQCNIWVLFPISRMENDLIHCNVWLYFNKLQNNFFDKIYKTWFIKKPWFEGSAFFFEKKTYQDLWWFDEKYPINVEDSDLSMRLYNMWYTIFLDTNLYVIHHWIDSRSNPTSICWKHQYYFCWLMRSMIKNYTLISLIKWLFISIWWCIVKVCMLSMKYKSILPLKWLLISIGLFIKDLRDTLKLRKYYQKIRIIKNDVFLKIR